jgi:nitrite reductase/ring-hydroxylating ferredoxin subunit
MDDSRRRFCQAGGGLLLASAVLPATGCGGTSGMMVFAGTTDQLPVGMVIFVTTPGYNINVCRDANGFYALDGNCTHAHCVLLFGDVSNPSGFACPCHTSTFDYNGQNPTGPAAATGPLKHYRVILDGTKIYVDPSTPVDITVRVS